MRGVIRRGDSTSHGGKVVSGQGKSVVMGLVVACVGDRCFCPISGHHDCVIVEGDPAVQIEGKPVAFDGHKTPCGATTSGTRAEVTVRPHPQFCLTLRGPDFLSVQLIGIYRPSPPCLMAMRHLWRLVIKLRACAAHGRYCCDWLICQYLVRKLLSVYKALIIMIIILD